MPNFPRVTLLALAAAAALMMSGCVDQTPTPTPSPTASSSPVFASEEEALAAATEAYAAYQEMSDNIFADGGSDPQRIAQFATGEALSAAEEGFASFAAQKYRSVGSSTFDNVTVQQYLPDSADGTGLVTLYLCLDIAAVDVLNESAVSVVSPTRPSKQAYEVAFDARSDAEAGLVVSRREAWAGAGVCAE